MSFIGKLFGGGKKQSTPKPAPVAAPPAPDRNVSGAVYGAGQESSNVLSNGNVARSTFLGG
jgi:hypothetical protein